MTLEPILWQTSQDGYNWTNMPTPSTYVLDLEDEDNESYREIEEGNLVRERIAPDWIKLQMSWNCIQDPAVVYLLRSSVKTNPKFYCRCKCAELTGTDGNWVTFIAYCTKFHSEYIEAQVGRKVNFNIIEADQGSWM